MATYLYEHGGSIFAEKLELAATLCQWGFEGSVDHIKAFNQCGGNLEASDYDSRTIAHLAVAEN